MTRHPIWLGLGANLGDPVAQLHRALDALAAHPAMHDLRVSSVWRGPYVGPEGPQPEYFNLCAAAHTDLDPDATLALCRAVEAAAGRPPRTHQAPRVLDIDLLLFDTLVARREGLVLPHPRMRERRFVLAPLAELDPGLGLPPDRAPVAELAQRPDVLAQPLAVVVGVRPWSAGSRESRAAQGGRR